MNCWHGGIELGGILGCLWHQQVRSGPVGRKDKWESLASAIFVSCVVLECRKGHMLPFLVIPRPLTSTVASSGPAGQVYARSSFP